MSDGQFDDHPHVFPEGRKSGEKLFAGITIVIGFLLLAVLPWQTDWIPKRGLAAQPRLWPALALSGTIPFGILNLAQHVALPRTPGRWTEAVTWVRSLEYIAWYMIYVAVIPVTGHLIATVLLCTLLTIRVG